jgi:hypothetical protein
MAGTSPAMTIFGCTVDTSVSQSPLYEAEPDSRGLVPGIHGNWQGLRRFSWIAGTSPAMTV